MTYEMMMETLEALGEDVSYCEGVGCFYVTIEDFAGFDDDYCEIDRQFDDEQAVQAFLEMLGRESTSQDGDYYVTYHFDGFDVQLGYASFDI